jgi:Arc/MetJ family transcription regulator
MAPQTGEQIMQTILTIDDRLFHEAARIANIQDQNQVIEMALREFIENHKRATQVNILDLYGAGGIREDYDYKALRRDGEA